jgi:hypothetical protein
MVCGFLVVSNWEEKSGDLDSDNFHRRCTGNAERQLSVPGSRLSVGLMPATQTRPLIFTDSHGLSGPGLRARPLRFLIVRLTLVRDGFEMP